MPSLRRDQVGWLLAGAALTLAPHAGHLPPAISALCALLLVWRGLIAQRGSRLPPRMLLAVLAVAATIALHKPLVAGTQTAIVVGTGEPLHTDRDGRTLRGEYVFALCEHGSSLAIAVHDGQLKRLDLKTMTLSVIDAPEVHGTMLRDDIYNFSRIGTFIVFVYVWLPFMILPIQAAVEQIPRSLLEASGDLGATPAQTFRTLILPLALPGVVAGSIFTFSLTLGDYIIPGIIGNSTMYIGQVVYMQQGTAGNLPFAAAFSLVPILIIAIYLTIAKRLGAFDAL